MARQMFHQFFQEEASKKTVGSWFKRNFLKVDLSIDDSSAPRVPFIALSEYRRFTLRDFS